MKLNDKNKNCKNKEADKKLIELAAERLAEIFVVQLEFNKNKHKNVNEKTR
jgi:hypothetical protein